MSGPLGKLKNYCECCKKQCKDENGYKLHLRSGHHQKMLAEHNANPHRHTSQKSAAFEEEFSVLFRTKYGYNKFVPVNRVYNEMVHDRHHTHMSGTRFGSLNGFAHYLQESSKDGPNHRGLIWKLQTETREFSKENGGMGQIDELNLMLVDRKAEEDNKRREQEISGRELERKREEKQIEKQIKMAQRIESKKQVPQEEEIATTKFDESKPIQIDMGVKGTAQKSQQAEKQAAQIIPAAVQKEPKPQAKQEKQEDETYSWLCKSQHVKIRDKRHKYYGTKCIIQDLDLKKDEVVLEVLQGDYKGKKIYLSDLYRCKKILKRVVPNKTGSKLTYYSRNDGVLRGQLLQKVNKEKHKGKIQLDCENKPFECPLYKICKLN